ncbi:MAG: TolC family protein [Paenacidovorax caeni]
MRAHLRPLALACALAALPGLAAATDLLQAWQAAQQHDRTLAVARAAHAAAQPQRDQAAALWRPGVALTAAAGVANGETQMHGAQFSAPGMGPTNGANVATSITGGTATRWQLQASQPLYNPQRRAQQEQLRLQADMADLQWQAQQQQAMLRTAQRYLDVAVAQEALRVIDQQHAAVQKAAEEAQERYRVGSAPITDTHEASARLAALRASQVAAQVPGRQAPPAGRRHRPARRHAAGTPASGPGERTASTALALEACSSRPKTATPASACRRWPPKQPAPRRASTAWVPRPAWTSLPKPGRSACTAVVPTARRKTRT